MMDTKLRLSLSVPGAQTLSEQECSKNPKNSYDTTVVSLEVADKKGKIHKEKIVVKTRKPKLVKQSINITKDAYDSMVDAQTPPTEKLNKKVVMYRVVGKKPNGKPSKVAVESTVWAANYSQEQRLKWHLDQIASTLGAVSYTYEIFDD